MIIVSVILLLFVVVVVVVVVVAVGIELLFLYRVLVSSLFMFHEVEGCASRFDYDYTMFFLMFDRFGS